MDTTEVKEAPVRKDGETWRFVYTGKTAHYLEAPISNEAICGSWQLRPDLWLGNNSDEEREKAKALPECRSCLRRLERI